MTDAAGGPTHILAVLDQGDAQIALRSAARLADRHGAALSVLATVEPPHDMGILARLAGQAPDALLAELVARRREAAQAQVGQACPGRGIEPAVAVGKTFVEVIRYGAERGCDFVVKKAEPLSGAPRVLFASTDQHLLRKCEAPVWLQTPDAPVAPSRVLAAVDLDLWDAAEPDTLMALNDTVLRMACAIATGPDPEVVVMHAWDAVGEGLVWAFSGGDDARLAADRYVNEVLEARDEAMTAFLARATSGGTGPRLVRRLVRGAPEQAIRAQCREQSAEVVVMGTVARTGLSGVFIGNTAENIINSLECPVLAVKPPGFLSPLR